MILTLQIKFVTHLTLVLAHVALDILLFAFSLLVGMSSKGLITRLIIYTAFNVDNCYFIFLEDDDVTVEN